MVNSLKPYIQIHQWRYRYDEKSMTNTIVDWKKYIHTNKYKNTQRNKITQTFSLQIVRKQSYETAVPFRIDTRLHLLHR